MQEIHFSRFPSGYDHGAQEPEVWEFCEVCNNEIHHGDNYLELGDGTILCSSDDYECLFRYTGAFVREAGAA